MEKLHIAITGRRNNGKSSLINLLTGQSVSIVSNIPGTTTDPVKKSFEIPGFASVIFIDTAGIDDIGQLGHQRVTRTSEILSNADFVILLITDNQFDKEEKEFINKIKSLNLPYLIVHNKSDLNGLSPELKKVLETTYSVPVIEFSCIQNNGTPLIEAIKQTCTPVARQSLLGNIIRKDNLILLVTPIDTEAPVGRLILPQVQLIRDILDNHCVSIVLQPAEIKSFIEQTKIIPDLVITDSQAFKTVAGLISPSIPLTSFSIVLAHHKGNFDQYVKGTFQIEKLQDNDTILILESCSHHSSCEDIGRVKIPTLLQKYTGKKLNFEFITGLDQLKQPATNFAMAIQCGGCMITGQQLKNRLLPFISNRIPVSNYGMTIAYTQGIFQRAITPFNNLTAKDQNSN